MITVIKKGISKREIRKRLKKVFAKKKDDGIVKFAGKLKTDINPLEFQRKMRDEWE